MTELQYERWKDFALRMAGACFNHARRPTAAWIIGQVENWFYWRDFQKNWCNYNSWDQDSYPLCDHISEFYDDLYPGAYCKACRHECRLGWPHYEQSCSMCEMECRCDEVEWLITEQFDLQWLGPVRCCIRAGIDLACEPSAGVVGFTVCDLRRMFPEGIPDWVNSGFVDRTGQSVDLNHGECNVPVLL